MTGPFAVTGPVSFGTDSAGSQRSSRTKKRNVTFPMQIGPNGRFTMQEKPTVSRIRFLLGFVRGQYTGRPTFGTDIQDVEQFGSRMDDIIKMQLLEIREALNRNIRDIQVLNVAANNEALQKKRVTFFIQYREVDGRETTVRVFERDIGLTT